MAERLGSGTVKLHVRPRVIAHAGLAGKKESEGPLSRSFDQLFPDITLGEKTWERSESRLLQNALQKAIEKSKRPASDIQAIFAGDLQNQSTASSFAMCESGLPYCGVYGACSTMALSLALAALAIETGGFSCTAAVTGSHFCTAERQFRKPLEYGGQRTPSAQWTVTGAGAAILCEEGKDDDPFLSAVHLGAICDRGVTDGANMGAAMAPAAKQTIVSFLRDTKTEPADFDLILTGDLGYVGSKLLLELAKEEDGVDLSGVHNDCGLMIFDREAQDVHAGGSGCGCSASVLCSHIFDAMRSHKYHRVLFVATGALLSATSALQGEPIPGIAHAVLIER